MLNVQLHIKNYALNIPWNHEIRPSAGTGRPEPVEGCFTRNALATNRHESYKLMGFKQALIIVALSLSVGPSFVQAESPKNIQDRGKAMFRDAEEMVMHGGMGDGKAIVHHCGEVAGHAEAILKALPLTDEHGREAVPHLQEAIKQCKRVAEMGDKVDPGASLNPATKARAAAREAMKHLNALRDGGA